MRILLVIFVLCVGALLFTALAAARHIRRHEEKRKNPAGSQPTSSGDPAPDAEVLVGAGKARDD